MAADRTHRKVPKNSLRLASLFMALLMWVNLSGGMNGEDNRVVRIFSNVPLVQQGVGENMKLSSELYQIAVTLSGLDSEMREVDASDIDVRLDLSGYTPETYNIPLGPNNVSIIGDFDTIAVEDIQPKTIRLTLERKAKKAVPIVMNTRGHPDLDFELAALEMTPPDAIIEGPASQVDDLSVLIAEPVDIDGARADVTGRVRFDFAKQVPEDATILNLNELTFTARIREIVETRSLGDPFVIKLRAPEKPTIKVKPTKVKLKMTGPVTLLDEVKAEWFAPFVELTAQHKKGDVVSIQTATADEVSDPELMLKVLAKIEIQWEPAEVEIQ